MAGDVLQKTYEYGDKHNTPYHQNTKAFFTAIQELTKEKNTWRLVSIASLFLLAASIGICFYAVNLPKSIPMIIEVSPWGEAKYSGDIAKVGQIQSGNIEPSIKYYLRKFIEKMRSVPSDRGVYIANLDEIYSFLTSQTSGYTTNILNKLQNYKLVGSSRIEVIVESIMKVRENTWQIDWVEFKTDLSGTRSEDKKRFRSIMNTKISTPMTEHLMDNPLGIYIESYDIEQILDKGDIE